jgi:hypothetical protein
MASIIKSDNGVSSGITGIVQSADSSGQLVLQTTTSSGTATTAVTIDNTQVATFANTLKAPNLQGPAFSAYMGSNQSVTSAVATKIQCNTKEFDTNNNFDNTTNYRFTPTVSGYYQVNAQLDTSGSASVTSGFIALYKNGLAFKQGNLIAGTINSKIVLSTLVYLNGTTDYIELYGFISGTSPAFSANAGVVGYFQASMVRSA